MEIVVTYDEVKSRNSEFGVRAGVSKNDLKALNNYIATVLSTSVHYNSQYAREKIDLTKDTFTTRRWNQFDRYGGFYNLLYSSSVTGCIHLTIPFSVLGIMYSCCKPLSGLAPCQCITPGGHFTTSPFFIV